jgi:dihydroorotase
LHIFIRLQRKWTLPNKILLRKKQITAEVCIHHLWFTNDDYATKGNLIKWNPAVKQLMTESTLGSIIG